MAPTVRQRWQSVRAKEVNLLSALDGLNDVSTSREDNSERKVTVPVEKKMGKSPRLKPKGWARRGVKDDISKEPNALSPLTLTKPVTPPGLAAVPSPRAGRNQKSIPKLRDGKGTPLRKNGADVFDYLGYGGRDLVSKSLGISVSGSGELLAKRDVVDAWTTTPTSSNVRSSWDEEGEGSANAVVVLDRLTAVRMSAEESRVRERKDKEEDIYYQFWKRETAERMEEEGGRKVAAGWAETRRMEEEEQKTMVKSGSTFLSIDLGDEEEEGDLGMTRAEEEVKRMRRRLLRGLEKDDMQIVSESDGDVEVDKMDIDPAKPRWRIDMPTDSDVGDTDTDGDTINEASWRRRNDLNQLMSSLTSIPTPKSRGGVGEFLLRSMVMGMESGGREENFVFERASMDKGGD